VGFGGVHINGGGGGGGAVWKTMDASTHEYTTCAWQSRMQITSSGVLVGAPIWILSSIDTDHYGIVTCIESGWTYVWWSNGNKPPESLSGCTTKYAAVGCYPVDYPETTTGNWGICLPFSGKGSFANTGGVVCGSTYDKPYGIFEVVMYVKGSPMQSWVSFGTLKITDYSTPTSDLGLTVYSGSHGVSVTEFLTENIGSAPMTICLYGINLNEYGSTYFVSAVMTPVFCPATV